MQSCEACGCRRKRAGSSPTRSAACPWTRRSTSSAFSPKKGAVIIKKVLLSAIANAEHNDGADVDELKVKTILVDKAESLRRFTARAKGRGNVILKQTCHIHVTVGDGK